MRIYTGEIRRATYLTVGLVVSAIAVIIASAVLQTTPTGRLDNMGYLGGYGIVAAVLSAFATVLLGRTPGARQAVLPKKTIAL